MTEELSRMKSIFHDSRDDFTNLYSTLHADFSERVSRMAASMSKVDEIRNLYERQIEMYKEDLKRVDLKVEKSLREMYADNYQTKQSSISVEENINVKINDMLRTLS